MVEHIYCRLQSVLHSKQPQVMQISLARSNFGTADGKSQSIRWAVEIKRDLLKLIKMYVK